MNMLPTSSLLLLLCNIFRTTNGVSSEVRTVDVDCCSKYCQWRDEDVSHCFHYKTNDLMYFFYTQVECKKAQPKEVMLPSTTVNRSRSHVRFRSFTGIRCQNLDFRYTHIYNVNLIRIYDVRQPVTYLYQERYLKDISRSLNRILLDEILITSPLVVTFDCCFRKNWINIVTACGVSLAVFRVFVGCLMVRWQEKRCIALHPVARREVAN